MNVQNWFDNLYEAIKSIRIFILYLNMWFLTIFRTFHILLFLHRTLKNKKRNLEQNRKKINLLPCMNPVTIPDIWQSRIVQMKLIWLYYYMCMLNNSFLKGVSTKFFVSYNNLRSKSLSLANYVFFSFLFFIYSFFF